MTEKFSGIVLRTRKYNDTLMIADIYTAERGRMSFLVPVTHSKRSKVRNVLFQPLSMLSFTSSVKAGRGLSRIGEAVPLTLYCSITGDVVKSSIALYIAELLSYALREDVKDEALYTFLDRSLTLLDNLADGYADFHLVFMVQLLRFLGIFPNLDDYTQYSYIDLVQGTAVNVHPLHGNFLMPQMAVPFVNLLRTDYSTMHRLSLNRKLRGELLAILTDYYRLHIPDFPKLKSMEVLKELFD